MRDAGSRVLTFVPESAALPPDMYLQSFYP